MKVTTKSEQPHLRSADTPYTSVTIKVSTSTRDQDKQQELAFLSLLVQALNPKVGLERVNEYLRRVVNPNAGFDFMGTDRQ
jgi:hypothetical protein